MTSDKFYDRLRSNAAQLRYQPDDVMSARLAARIRARLAAQPTVAQMLARWIRPVTATFAMLAVVAALSVTWVERRESTTTTELVASNSVEISLDGDTYSFGGQ